MKTKGISDARQTAVLLKQWQWFKYFRLYNFNQQKKREKSSINGSRKILYAKSLAWCVCTIWKYFIPWCNRDLFMEQSLTFIMNKYSNYADVLQHHSSNTRNLFPVTSTLQLHGNPEIPNQCNKLLKIFWRTLAWYKMDVKVWTWKIQ